MWVCKSFKYVKDEKQEIVDFLDSDYISLHTYRTVNGFRQIKLVYSTGDSGTKCTAISELSLTEEDECSIYSAYFLAAIYSMGESLYKLVQEAVSHS